MDPEWLQLNEIAPHVSAALRLIDDDRFARFGTTNVVLEVVEGSLVVRTRTFAARGATVRVRRRDCDGGADDLRWHVNCLVRATIRPADSATGRDDQAHTINALLGAG